MMLYSNRLAIREISATDINDIHELHSLPQTDEFNTLGIPESIATTTALVHEWLAAQNTDPRNAYTYCITLNDTKQFIGLIGLKPGKPKYRIAEIWYKIHVQYWNHGYATEALTRILSFGFNELKLHRIEAGCAVENSASAKVLQKAGMTKEGMKRKILPIRGEWKDNYFFGILEEDFKIS